MPSGSWKTHTPQNCALPNSIVPLLVQVHTMPFFAIYRNYPATCPRNFCKTRRWRQSSVDPEISRSTQYVPGQRSKSKISAPWAHFRFAFSSGAPRLWTLQAITGTTCRLTTLRPMVSAPHQRDGVSLRDDSPIWALAVS